MTPISWILNLDAEEELRDGRRRDPHAALEQRPHLEAALAPLLTGGEVLRRGARAPAGAVGRAFTPTPSALAALAAAGATPPPAPPPLVLQRVLDRRFALGLPGATPGSLAASSVHEVEAALREGVPAVIKGIFSFAGRGRTWLRDGVLGGSARAFLERALERDGAVVVEPWLPRAGDFAIHGHVDDRGRALVGAPTVQEVSADGTWRQSRAALPGELSDVERAWLQHQAARAADALAGASYFGPFGLDAMRLADGALARCELNARYTMGWAVGMGALRPDLPANGHG